MKKRFLTLAFALVLCASCFTFAFADSIPAERQLDRLTDEAALLTSSQQTTLNALLDEISERQQCDVAIITVDRLGDYSNATEFADDAFDYYGFGMGEDDSGILFLISMEERDWAISTYGFGITAFTDEGQRYITEKILPDLGEGYYSDAFTSFAKLCDEFLTQAKTGAPYDSGSLPKEPLSIIWIPISLAAGLLIAAIATAVMRSTLKSVHMQPAAACYVRQNSMNVTERNDAFLYRKVDRYEKPEETSSSGGSSTHSSSSGRTHGGSSGKF